MGEGSIIAAWKTAFVGRLHSAALSEFSRPSCRLNSLPLAWKRPAAWARIPPLRTREESWWPLAEWHSSLLGRSGYTPTPASRHKAPCVSPRRCSPCSPSTAGTIAARPVAAMRALTVLVSLLPACAGLGRLPSLVPVHSPAMRAGSAPRPTPARSREIASDAEDNGHRRRDYLRSSTSSGFLARLLTHSAFQ